MIATIRRRLLGLLLVAVLIGGVALSIALYQRAFTPVVSVKLQSGNIGNQLLKQSDVKVRGLIVGSVKEITATPDGIAVSGAVNGEYGISEVSAPWPAVIEHAPTAELVAALKGREGVEAKLYDYYEGIGFGKRDGTVIFVEEPEP